MGFRYIPSIEDDRQGVMTYELEDGRRACLDRRAVQKFGAAELLHSMGIIEDPARMARLPVYQRGVVVGSLPGAFDPDGVQSSSFLYDPRPGDFVVTDGKVLASPQLGPGDLEAVVGFSRA